MCALIVIGFQGVASARRRIWVSVRGSVMFNFKHIGWFNSFTSRILVLINLSAANLAVSSIWMSCVVYIARCKVYVYSKTKFDLIKLNLSVSSLCRLGREYSVLVSSTFVLFLRIRWLNCSQYTSNRPEISSSIEGWFVRWDEDFKTVCDMVWNGVAVAFLYWYICLA
jgi:hypothetical protein